MLLKVAVTNAAFGPGVALAADCGPAVQTERGPFYPKGEIPTARELLKFPLDGPAVQDQVIHVGGLVLSQDCEPVSGARVVIWQADSAGLYLHPDAIEGAQPNARFLYYAQTMTDRFGAYRFTTLLPSPYKYAGLSRARHLHFEVWSPLQGTSTTEMYFAGKEEDQRRSRDRVWLSRDANLRNALISAPVDDAVRATGHPAFPLDEFRAYRFDIRFPNTESNRRP